jgi:hypothetical protein
LFFVLSPNAPTFPDFHKNARSQTDRKTFKWGLAKGICSELSEHAAQGKIVENPGKHTFTLCETALFSPMLRKCSINSRAAIQKASFIMHIQSRLHIFRKLME